MPSTGEGAGRGSLPAPWLLDVLSDRAGRVALGRRCGHKASGGGRAIDGSGVSSAGPHTFGRRLPRRPGGGGLGNETTGAGATANGLGLGHSGLLLDENPEVEGRFFSATDRLRYDHRYHRKWSPLVVDLGNRGGAVVTGSAPFAALLEQLLGSISGRCRFGAQILELFFHLSVSIGSLLIELPLGLRPWWARWPWPLQRPSCRTTIWRPGAGCCSWLLLVFPPCFEAGPLPLQDAGDRIDGHVHHLCNLAVAILCRVQGQDPGSSVAAGPVQ